jgi:hypothetical protein
MKTPKAWLDTIVLNQFSFSEGYQSIVFESPIDTDLYAFNSTSRSLYQVAATGSSSIDWVSDNDLVVCP